MRPIISFKTKLSDLVSIQCPVSIPDFREACNISALNVFLTARPHRLTNSAILQSYFDRYLEFATANRKRGTITNADTAVLGVVNNGAAKITPLEDSAAHMSERLFNLDESQHRLRRKLVLNSSYFCQL